MKDIIKEIKQLGEIKDKSNLPKQVNQTRPYFQSEKREITGKYGCHSYIPWQYHVLCIDK
jgi:hypothetical protein